MIRFVPLVVALLLLLCQLFVYEVQAENPVVVLRGMSAVPAEGSEWIAVENVSSATISGQIWSLRDVQGSVKTWLLPALQPYELRMFSSSETKMSLNNSGDQVELLQGSTVVQSSSPYEELSSGSLWVLLSDGWQELNIEEWERRWPIRDWQAKIVAPPASTQPSHTPIAMIVPSAVPVPLPLPSGIPKKSPLPVSTSSEKDWWDDVPLPMVAYTSTQSAVPISTPAIWERPPGDFDGEWRVFQSWKREIWYRLGVTFFASLFTLALSAPKLYRCYNDLCLLDDG